MNGKVLWELQSFNNQKVTINRNTQEEQQKRDSSNLICHNKEAEIEAAFLPTYCLLVTTGASYIVFIKSLYIAFLTFF